MKPNYIQLAYSILNKTLKEVTVTEPGALPYLLHGSRPSHHSFYIKFGKHFEEWFKYVIEDCNFQLLPDGILKDVVGSNSKDVDILFKNPFTDVIYYRELKSNILLDTEKLPATIFKIQKVSEYLKLKYPECEIDTSLMTWSVYDIHDLPKTYNPKLKKVNSADIQITTPSDLFKLIGADISKSSYYDMFRELGTRSLM